jgi:RNA polymerase-binding transcription factor DksA
MDKYCELRQYLTARLTQLERHLDQIKTDCRRATNLLDSDLEEQAALRQYDTIVEKLAEEECRQVVTIRAALARMAAGIYGICKTCEEPIAPQRLAALPYALQCLECAIQAEQEALHRR